MTPCVTKNATNKPERNDAAISASGNANHPSANGHHKPSCGDFPSLTNSSGVSPKRVFSHIILARFMRATGVYQPSDKSCSTHQPQEAAAKLHADPANPMRMPRQRVRESW